MELSIENRGSFAVHNPRVVSNGKRRWFTMADIVAEAYAGAATDSEKMYRSWNFERQVHYHSMPLFGENELHDPVKYFNMYGTGFCDDAGNNFVSLNWHGGFTAAAKGKDPKLRSLNGHVQGELYFDGDYHFMDIDENMFYLDSTNSRVVSGDAVALDHDLGKREHTWQGPASASQPSPGKSSSGAEEAVALFGRDDGGNFPHVGGHTMDFSLRPCVSAFYVAVVLSSALIFCGMSGTSGWCCAGTTSARSPPTTTPPTTAMARCRVSAFNALPSTHRFA